MNRDAFTDAILLKVMPEGLFTDNPIPQHLWPRCARCNRPVDRVVSTREAGGAATKFVAFCHGESEAAELPDTALVQGRVVEAVAFSGRTPPFRPEGTEQPAKPDRAGMRASLSSPSPDRGTFASPPPRSSPPFSGGEERSVKQLSPEAVGGALEQFVVDDLRRAVDRMKRG